MSHVASMAFGRVPMFKRGDKILICETRGCMAERLEVTGEGVILRHQSIPVANADYKLAGIVIRLKDGSETVELNERVRKLADGRLAVVNP